MAMQLNILFNKKTTVDFTTDVVQMRHSQATASGKKYICGIGQIPGPEIEFKAVELLRL